MRAMRIGWGWFGLLAWLVTGCGGAARWPEPVPQPPAIDVNAWAADARWLADPAREGRGLGTPGLAASAQYLAEGFRAAGLEPAAPTGGYLQEFEMPVSIAVARAELRHSRHTFQRGREFAALLESESGDVQGPLVFAGYGVTSEETDWDDYAGLNVEGAIVVVLEGLPAALTSQSGHGAFASRAYKLLNARQHGAKAILLAPDHTDHTDEPHDLGRVAGPMGANPTRPSAGLLALLVSRSAAERLTGGALSSHQEALAAGKPLAPRVQAAETAQLTVEIERSRGSVANVLARLPGSDPLLDDEVVVVGAHYDHLGGGAFGSLAPERRGEVHPGADDNASGAAGLLALARSLAVSEPRRTLLFAAFTAEEAGLVGSSHLLENAPVPKERIVAMINLDMIGRMRDDAVTVFGTGTGAGFEDLLERAEQASALDLSLEGDGHGPSDHTSFVAEGVPALFFFTGTHPQYHTPSDTADLLDPAETERVLGLVRFTGTAGHAPSPTGGGGYGPYLGTVPAFGGAPVEGVRLAAVRPGSPAEKAGIRGGDVIVAFGGTPVRRLEDYAALLFTGRAGQEVEIVLLRDGERLTVRATLGRRR
jgi:hypothetical protein